MAKLYPPVIEGTIPAFNGTTELVVPFSMNRSVSASQIKGFALQVKTVQSNTWVTTLTDGTLNQEGTAAVFTDFGDSWEPNPGQYYKLQLAYIDETNTIGYYSTVGVIKYTSISNNDITLYSGNTEIVSEANTYVFNHSYMAVYDYTNDPLEKIYNYRFVLYTDTQDIAYDSGWLLHDATLDNSVNKSVDTYTFLDDLESNTTYLLQYQAITVNGLLLATKQYNIVAEQEIMSQYDMTLIAECNKDNGYVALTPHTSEEYGDEKYISGRFKIYRANITNTKRWEPIFNFVLQQEQPSKIVWKDFTVEHGETYIYKICQYNEAELTALCAYSGEVYVDFEDMFLFDGERQLKIQYNPKVSSFKNDILESKLDTIGSQYPFFFRNGHVHYKEFPISGLISYWVDNEELFIPLSEMGLVDIENYIRYDTKSTENLPKNYKTKNLVDYNIAAERKFKLDVLEWLTNGKPKLFRSPTEGNYIVRLLNTSLTPNDTVGRMLHTFNCTAYEIDDLTYENLGTYGFISAELNEKDTTALRFRTLKLKDIYQNLDNNLYSLKTDDNGEKYIELLIDPRKGGHIVAQSVLIEDCEYGDMFVIDDQTIMIGITQSYNLDNLHPISSIKFYPSKVAAIRALNEGVDPFIDVSITPQVTYSYYGGFTGLSLFDMVSKIDYQSVPARQFTRANLNANVYDTAGVLIQKPIVDIIPQLEDVKTTVTKYFEVQFEQRPVEDIYSAVNWNTIELNKDTLTDEFIENNFTFDKTGYGRGGEFQSALTFIKNSPFYLFHIVPITLYDFTKAQSESGLFSNYHWTYVLIDRDKLETDQTYRAKYLSASNKLIKTRTYYTLNAQNEYQQYTHEEMPESGNLYAYVLIDDNEAEFPNNLYYIDDRYIDDPNAKDYYLQYSTQDEQFLIYERQNGITYKFDTAIYMNTEDNNILTIDTKNKLDNVLLEEQPKDSNGNIINENAWTNELNDWVEAMNFGAKIDVADTRQPVLYHNLDKINNLYIGNAVLATLSYQTAIITYTFEETDSDIKNLKTRYQHYLTKLQEGRNATQNYGTNDPDFTILPTNSRYAGDENISKTRLQWVLDSYSDFITTLTARINEWKEENGIND